MRIAYVNINYQKNHSGGGQTHIDQFIRNCIGLGHEIWTYPGDKFPGTQNIPTDRLTHIKTLRRMDALYIRLENRSPAICGWSIPPRRSLYRLPVVVWEFNTLPDELAVESIGTPVTTGNLLHKSSHGCDLAVCVSPALSENVKKHLAVHNVITVPNGSDPDLFKPGAPVVDRLAPFKDNFNVVWMGSIKETWHDLELLKQAAKLLWEKSKDWRIIFHILGKDLIGVMGGMPPNVYYWGAEYYQDLPNWLTGMDAGLSLYHPGKADFGSPLKVFDYLSSGLAVLSTSHPLVGKILGEIQAPDLVIPHGDAEALAQALVNLAENKERTRKIGKAGRQLVIDKYNWRRAVKDTMDAMEKILDEKNAHPRHQAGEK